MTNTYNDIEEMIVEMYLLCEELKNKDQEYIIDKYLPDPPSPYQRYGFVIWWQIRHPDFGIVIKEEVKGFQLVLSSLELADTMTKTIFKNEETRIILFQLKK